MLKEAHKQALLLLAALLLESGLLGAATVAKKLSIMNILKIG